MRDEIKLLKEQPDGTFTENVSGGKLEGDGNALILDSGNSYFHVENRIAGEDLNIGDIVGVPSVSNNSNSNSNSLTGTVLSEKKLSDIDNIKLVNIFSGDDANNQELDGKGMTLGAVVLNATDYIRFLNVDGTGEVNKFEFRTITTHTLLFTTTLPIIGSDTVPYYLGVIAENHFLYIGIDRTNSRLIGIIGNWTGTSVTWGNIVELESGVHPTEIFYSSNFSSYDSPFISSNKHRSRVEFLSNNHMVFHYWVSDLSDPNQKRSKVVLMSHSGTTLTLHQSEALETALGTPVNTAQPRIEVQEFYQIDPDPNYQIVDLNTHYIAFSSTPSNSFKIFHKKDGLVGTYTLPANEVLINAAYSPIRGFFQAVLLVRNTVTGTLKLAYNPTLTGAVILDTDANYVNSSSYLNSQIVVRFTSVSPSFPTRNTLSFAAVAIIRNDNAEVKVYTIPVTGIPENLTAFGTVNNFTISGSGFSSNRIKLLVNQKADDTDFMFLFLHDGTNYRVIKFNKAAAILANVVQTSSQLLSLNGFGNFKIHQIGNDEYRIILRDSNDDFHVFLLNRITSQLSFQFFIDSSEEMSYGVNDFAAVKFYEDSFSHPKMSLIVQHTPVVNTTALRYSIINFQETGIINKKTLLVPTLTQNYSGTSTAYMQYGELVSLSTAYRAGEFWFGTIFHDTTAVSSSIFSMAIKDCTQGLEGEIEEIGNYTSQALNSTLPIQTSQVNLMLPVSSRFTVLIQQSGANVELNLFDNLSISSMVVQRSSFIGDFLSIFPFLDTQLEKMIIEENKFWISYLSGSSIRCRVITINNDATITIGVETIFVSSFSGTITAYQHHLYERFGEVFGVIAYQTSNNTSRINVVEAKFITGNNSFSIITSTPADGLSFTSILTIIYQPLSNEGLGRIEIILRNATQLIALGYLANTGLYSGALTENSLTTETSLFSGFPLKVYQNNQFTVLWFISPYGLAKLILTNGEQLNATTSYMNSFAPNLILGANTSLAPLYSSIEDIRKSTDKAIIITSSYSGIEQKAILLNIQDSIVKTSEFTVTLGGTIYPNVGINVSSRLSGLLSKPNSTNYLLQIAFENLNSVKTCYAAIEIQDSFGKGSLVLSSKYAEGTLARIQNTDNCLLMKATYTHLNIKFISVNTTSSTMTLTDETGELHYVNKYPFYISDSYKGILKVESLTGGRFWIQVHPNFMSTQSHIIKRTSANSYSLSSYKWEQFNKLREKTPLVFSSYNEAFSENINGFLELINYGIYNNSFGIATSIRIDGNRIAFYLSGTGLLMILTYIDQEGTEGVLNLSEFSLPPNIILRKISQASTSQYSPGNFFLIEYTDTANINAHGQNYFQTILDAGSGSVTITTQKSEILANSNYSFDSTKLYKTIRIETGDSSVITIPPHHIPEPTVIISDLSPLGFSDYGNRDIESILINEDIIVSVEHLVGIGSGLFQMVFRSVSKKKIVYIAGAFELGFGSMYNEVEPSAIGTIGDNLFAVLSSEGNVFIYEWKGTYVELKTISEKIPSIPSAWGYLFSNSYKKPGTRVYYSSLFTTRGTTTTVRIFRYNRDTNIITFDANTSDMQGVTYPPITPYYSGATEALSQTKVLITDSIGNTIRGVLVKVSQYYKASPPVSQEVYVRIKQFTINHLDEIPTPTQTSPGVKDVTPYIAPNNPAWKYQGDIQKCLNLRPSANFYEIPNCYFYDFGLGDRFLSLFYVAQVVSGGSVLSNDQGMNFALINLDTETVVRYTDVTAPNEFNPIFGNTLSARQGFFKIYHINDSKFLLSFIEGDYNNYPGRLKRLYSKLFDLKITFNSPNYDITVTPLSGSSIDGSMLDIGGNYNGEYIPVFEEVGQLICPNSLFNPNFNITSIIPLVHFWASSEGGPIYTVFDNFYQAKLEKILEQITPSIPTPTMQPATLGVANNDKFSPAVGTNNLMVSNPNTMTGYSILPVLDSELGVSTAKISIKDATGATVHNALMPLASNATDGRVLATTAIPLVDNKFLIIFNHSSAPLVIKAAIGTFIAPNTISYSTIFDIANLESGFTRFVFADIQTTDAVANISNYLFIFQEFSNTGYIRKTKTYILTVDHAVPLISSEKISTSSNGEDLGSGFNQAYQTGTTEIAQVPYPLTKLSENKYVAWMGNKRTNVENNTVIQPIMIRGIKGLSKTWRQFLLRKENLIIPNPTDMRYLFINVDICRKSYVVSGTDEQLTIFQNINLSILSKPASIFINQLSMRGVGINQIGYNIMEDCTMYLPVSIGKGVNAALMRIGESMHFVYFSNNEALGSILVSKSIQLSNGSLFSSFDMRDFFNKNYIISPKIFYPNSKTYLYKEFNFYLATQAYFSNIIPDLSSEINLEILPELLSTLSVGAINFSSIGIVTTGASANNTATYLRAGIFEGLSGLIAGRLYYAGSSGNLTLTPNGKPIGLSLSPTSILLFFSD